MEFKKYVKNCRRTLSTPKELDVEHSIIGISTEAGELLDALKKHKYYGRDLDVKNIKEEIGDTLWYLAVLCDAVNYTFEDAMEDNILKLAKRYPDKFKDVLDRNQDVELSHISDGEEDKIINIDYSFSENLEYRSYNFRINLTSKSSSKVVELFNIDTPLAETIIGDLNGKKYINGDIDVVEEILVKNLKGLE